MAQEGQGKAKLSTYSLIPRVKICKSKDLFQAGPWATGGPSDNVILQASVGLGWMNLEAREVAGREDLLADRSQVHLKGACLGPLVP